MDSKYKIQTNQKAGEREHKTFSKAVFVPFQNGNGSYKESLQPVKDGMQPEEGSKQLVKGKSK